METEAFPPTIAGLVLTVPAEPAAQAAVLAQLRAFPGITLGELHDRWLSIAAETTAPHDLHAQLEAIPGVTHVEVAFIEVS